MSLEKSEPSGLGDISDFLFKKKESADATTDDSKKKEGNDNEKSDDKSKKDKKDSADKADSASTEKDKKSADTKEASSGKKEDKEGADADKEKGKEQKEVNDNIRGKLGDLNKDVLSGLGKGSGPASPDAPTGPPSNVPDAPVSPEVALKAEGAVSGIAGSVAKSALPILADMSQRPGIIGSAASMATEFLKNAESVERFIWSWAATAELPGIVKMFLPGVEQVAKKKQEAFALTDMIRGKIEELQQSNPRYAVFPIKFKTVSVAEMPRVKRELGFDPKTGEYRNLERVVGPFMDATIAIASKQDPARLVAGVEATTKELLDKQMHATVLGKNAQPDAKLAGNSAPKGKPEEAQKQSPETAAKPGDEQLAKTEDPTKKSLTNAPTDTPPSVPGGLPGADELKNALTNAENNIPKGSPSSPLDTDTPNTSTSLPA